MPGLRAVPGQVNREASDVASALMRFSWQGCGCAAEFPPSALQVMTDVVGNPEEERRAEFYHEPWSQEAVSRYFYCKVRRWR